MRIFGPLPRLACTTTTRPRSLPLSSRASSAMQACQLHSALGCNVYVSEGCNKQLVAKLQAEAEATPGVVLANTFVDEPYNRTGFTLVSSQPDRLAAAVVRLARSALRLLDLRFHAASHPRLGAVDHISLHPLGSLVAPPPSQSVKLSNVASLPAEGAEAEGTAAAAASTAAAADATSAGAGPSTAHSNNNKQQRQQQQHQQRQGGPEGALAAAQGSASGNRRSGPSVWLPPPAGPEGMAAAAACALQVAGQLAEGAPAGPAAGATWGAEAGAGAVAAVPVYLYGHAHPARRTLAEVRRQLGYFQRSQQGDWHGELRLNHHPQPSPPQPPRPQFPQPHQEQYQPSHPPQQQSPDTGTAHDNCGADTSYCNAHSERNTAVPQRQPQPLPLDGWCPPDLGPAQAPPQSGVVTVGAVPWVVNYNVPLEGVELREARRLARALSERGGGLPHVEAMALAHADGCVEVACNLLDAAVTSPQRLQRRLAELAAEAGLPAAAVRQGYRTNKSPEELMRVAAAAATEAEPRR